MKARKKNIVISSSLLIICGLLISFCGCSKNSPLSQFDEEKQENGFTQTSVIQANAQSDIGQITFLKLQSDVVQVFQNDLTDNILSVEMLVEANSGGVVKLGLDSLGFCMLKFKSGDLPSDQTIKIQWDMTDGIFVLDFGPEGLQFNNPVEFKMLYKSAKINKVDEDKINLFYYNENLKIWQVMGGKSDKKNKMFKGEIPHFSRYSLAHSE